MKHRFAAIVCLVLTMTFAACDLHQAPTDMSADQADVRRVIAILSDEHPPDADVAFLRHLSDSDWEDVTQIIEAEELTFYRSGVDDPTIAVAVEKGTSCPWDGTIRYNPSITATKNYRFQGHHAVYFVVPSDANCYDKDADWWVHKWTPTHGHINTWDLLLARDRYWSPAHGRYVKDVALIVPSYWWDVYYWAWTSSFKAARFTLSWNNRRTGCCE